MRLEHHFVGEYVRNISPHIIIIIIAKWNAYKHDKGWHRDTMCGELHVVLLLVVQTKK